MYGGFARKRIRRSGKSSLRKEPRERRRIKEAIEQDLGDSTFEGGGGLILFDKIKHGFAEPIQVF
jgi:hypothetical protein